MIHQEVTYVGSIERSKIHQEVRREIQTLHYRFVDSFKIVLRQNLSLFDEFLDSEDYRSTDEESD